MYYQVVNCQGLLWDQECDKQKVVFPSFSGQIWSTLCGPLQQKTQKLAPISQKLQGLGPRWPWWSAASPEDNSWSFGHHLWCLFQILWRFLGVTVWQSNQRTKGLWREKTVIHTAGLLMANSSLAQFNSSFQELTSAKNAQAKIFSC